MRLVCLSIPCPTLIFTPSESMTEVMARTVYLPKHAMLDTHFIFTPPASMTEVMTTNVYLPKHSMLNPHFHTT